MTDDLEDLPPLPPETAADKGWRIDDSQAQRPSEFRHPKFEFVSDPNETLDQHEERYDRECAAWLQAEGDKRWLAQQAAKVAAEQAIDDEDAACKAHWMRQAAEQATMPQADTRPSRHSIKLGNMFGDDDRDDPRYTPDHARQVEPVAPVKDAPTIHEPPEPAPKHDLLNESDEPVKPKSIVDCLDPEDRVNTPGRCVREYVIYQHLVCDMRKFQESLKLRPLRPQEHGRRALFGAVFLYDLWFQLSLKIKDDPDTQHYCYDSAAEVARRTGLSIQMVETLRRELSGEDGPLVTKKLRSRQLQYGLRKQKEFDARIAAADKNKAFVTCLRSEAEKFGIPAAIIYSNRGYYHRTEQQQDHRIHAGRSWRYFSIGKAVGPAGPYEGILSHDQVWRALKLLVQEKAVLTLNYFEGRGHGPGVYRQDRVWITFDLEPVTDKVVSDNHVKWNGLRVDGKIYKNRSAKAPANSPAQQCHPAQPTKDESVSEKVTSKVETEKAGRSAEPPIGSAEAPVTSAEAPIGSAEATVTFHGHPTQPEGTAESSPRPLETPDMKPLTATRASLAPQEKNLEKRPSAVPGDAGRATRSMPAASPTSPALADPQGHFASLGKGNVGFAAEGTEGIKDTHQHGAAGGRNGTHQDGLRAGGPEAHKSQRPGSRRPQADVEPPSEGAAGVTVPEDVQKSLLELKDLGVEVETRPTSGPRNRPSSTGAQMACKDRPDHPSEASTHIDLPVEPSASAAHPHAPEAGSSKQSSARHGTRARGVTPTWREPETKHASEVMHDNSWDTSVYASAYNTVLGHKPDHTIGNPQEVCECAHKVGKHGLPVKCYIIAAIHLWHEGHPGRKFDGKNVKWLASEACFNAVQERIKDAPTQDEVGLAVVLRRTRMGVPHWRWRPAPRDKFIQECERLNGGPLSKADYEVALRVLGDRSKEDAVKTITMQVRITLRARSGKKTFAEGIQSLLEEQ